MVAVRPRMRNSRKFFKSATLSGWSSVFRSELCLICKLNFIFQKSTCFFMRKVAQKPGNQFEIFIFRIGPAQTRLVSQILYTGAWVALAFYRVQQYLIYCWMLLAFSGMISNKKKFLELLGLKILKKNFF